MFETTNQLFIGLYCYSQDMKPTALRLAEVLLRRPEELGQHQSSARRTLETMVKWSKQWPDAKSKNFEKRSLGKSWSTGKMLHCHTWNSKSCDFVHLPISPMTLMGRRNSAAKTSVQHGFRVPHNHVQHNPSSHILSACAKTPKSAQEPFNFHNIHHCPTSLLPTHTAIHFCPSAKKLLGMTSLPVPTSGEHIKRLSTGHADHLHPICIPGTVGHLWKVEDLTLWAFACSIQGLTERQQSASCVKSKAQFARSSHPPEGPVEWHPHRRTLWFPAPPRGVEAVDPFFAENSHQLPLDHQKVLTGTASSNILYSKKKHRGIHSALNGAEAIPTAHSPPIPSLSLQMMDIFLGSKLWLLPDVWIFSLASLRLTWD